MKHLSIICFLVAAVLGYLEHFDRSSPTALSVVEWSQSLGIPLFIVAIIVGLLAAVTSILKPAPKTRTPRKRTQNIPAQAPTKRPVRQNSATLPPIDPIDPDKSVSARQSNWREQVRNLANEMDLGKGARITIEMDSTAPLTLHLEHLSPAHCKRAIAACGSLISVIPVPPRLKVVFDHCPQAGVPRHHQVAGALSQVVPRGHFRVVSHVDTVDVMFLHPDSAWSAPILND